jgi:phosphoglycerate dehydrogenase-like enzyme
LFEKSDVVTIHLVLGERTRGLVRAEDLALMKPGAILVNTSRGPIVVEKDLLNVLQTQKLHAALDVYEREPLPADHPLRKLENVTLSPHLGYVHDDNYRIFYSDTLENVAAWMSGKPLRVINA